ncbi:GFA family protein [Vibrio mangrovi]|uniref:GFA family protein n=1 Tax=Vibrio mangrovi TaxID=474394 RepID=A0A1Y6IVX9_9VIBR|nr:GFA family protein [Vibrio mangrovi]MDW6004689.1 GFA family protein [Vibrio mangrovi]SMS00980.1 Putative glutathione-dependent formaldehyde-activating enzyme [Vibrio mangrovi]
MEFPIHGSCQCGQVTYELLAAPQKVMACHCQECQKLSSAPFSVTAMMSAENIRFSGKMKEWSRVADSGNTNIAKFCPDCGTRIYHVNPEVPDSIKLKLKPTGLADASLFAPSMHIWISEKLSWYTIPEGMPTAEKQP